MEVLRLLQDAYGPEDWRPRLDPVSELVFTILSQHTSDLNSERAFDRLHAAIPTWEAVAQADVAEIIKHVAVAGLGYYLLKRGSPKWKYKVPTTPL